MVAVKEEQRSSQAVVEYFRRYLLRTRKNDPSDSNRDESTKNYV